MREISVSYAILLLEKKQICFNCLQSGNFIPKCPSKSRCMHCRCMYHSLHLAEGKIAKVLIDQARAADESKTPISNASSSIGGTAVANVQTVQTEISHTFNVLFAIPWIDLHTAESRCVKVHALLNQGSILSFISESLCQILQTKQ